MSIFFSTSKQPSSVKCEQGIGEGAVSFKNRLEKDTENSTLPAEKRNQSDCLLSRKFNHPHCLYCYRRSV